MKKIFLICALFLNSAIAISKSDDIVLRVSQNQEFLFLDITNLSDSDVVVNRRMTPNLGGYDMVFIKDRKEYSLAVLPHYYSNDSDDLAIKPMMGLGSAKNKKALMLSYHLAPGCYDLKAIVTNTNTKSSKKFTIEKTFKNICFSAELKK
jgi:hypothetical protein